MKKAIYKKISKRAAIIIISSVLFIGIALASLFFVIRSNNCLVFDEATRQCLYTQSDADDDKPRYEACKKDILDKNPNATEEELFGCSIGR